jgi:hypothetical protein
MSSEGISSHILNSMRYLGPTSLQKRKCKIILDKLENVPLNIHYSKFYTRVQDVKRNLPISLESSSRWRTVWTNVTTDELVWNIYLQLWAN